MSSLSGKTAIITGGATGIGLGIARVLASKGVRLVLAQKNVALASEARKQLTGGDVLPLEVDISKPPLVESMVQAAVDHFGAVDILVNNASLTGTIALTSFLDCTPGQLDAMVDTNLKGTFYCSQAVARRMVQSQTHGVIIHIASVGAWAAQELASAYCATKAAQVSLAQTMALELAPYGIRVNAIAPGDIATQASANVREDVKAASGSGRYLRVTPLGRRGDPADIGNAVAFLASDQAAFITGATLLVDGGLLSY